MTQETIFSKREKEVIALLLEGKSNKQIALTLGISISTAEFHLGNIYSKLHLSSRSEAILMLSKNHLWESIGEPNSNNLQETPVELDDNPSHNKGKLFESIRSFSMKTIVYIGTGLVAVILIFILFLTSNRGGQKIEQPTAIPFPTEETVTAVPDRPTPTPSPTLSPREKNIAEAQRLAAEYDQAVKVELQKGNVEIGKDVSSGKETFHFQGNSLETILQHYESLNQQLEVLNKEYLALYIADVQPTPFPTKTTQNDNDDYYQYLLGQYQNYFDQLLKDGPTVMIYDPSDGIYYARVIGDTYAKSEIMTRAIETLHMAPEMAKVDKDAHMAQIRKITGNPDAQLSFNAIQGLANAPWITAAIYTDENGTKYWVAINTGRVVSIEIANRIDVPAAEVKSIDKIRPIAEQFVIDNSSQFAQLKSKLVYEEGGKGDIYFFTWSYRSKNWAGTSWAMMPPFIQVGVTADGKIATYNNTLDLIN